MLFRRKKEKNLNGNQKIPGRSVRKLKERKGSLKKGKAVFPPRHRRKYIFGKVFFCISAPGLRRASMAVETAMVLPLFFMGMVTMICFMDIYKLQTEHLTKLCEKAKEAGMYAYLSGEGAKELTFPDMYVYQPVGGLIPLPDVRMYNLVKVHAWTGKETGDGMEGETDGGEEENGMVYVTESGSVYHKHADCTYLRLSIQQVSGASATSRRNIYGERYQCCDSCSRGQPPAGMVFITKTGNRYHNSRNCSGLKRTVRLVKPSYVEGMDACSRCGS